MTLKKTTTLGHRQVDSRGKAKWHDFLYVFVIVSSIHIYTYICVRKNRTELFLFDRHPLTFRNACVMKNPPKNDSRSYLFSTNLLDVKQHAPKRRPGGRSRDVVRLLLPEQFQFLHTLGLLKLTGRVCMHWFFTSFGPCWHFPEVAMPSATSKVAGSSTLPPPPQPRWRPCKMCGVTINVAYCNIKMHTCLMPPILCWLCDHKMLFWDTSESQYI